MCFRGNREKVDAEKSLDCVKVPDGELRELREGGQAAGSLPRRDVTLASGLKCDVA